MTWIDWVIIGIGVAALFCMVGLVVKYWNKLRLLDLDAMPKAKQRSKKYQLIEERLQRKAKDARNAAAKGISPAKDAVVKHFSRWYEKIVELERKYRHAMPTPATQEEKEKTRQKIASIMESAVALYKEGKLAEAEHLFLDIIRLNPKEVEAYEYLGELYSQKKEYDHAIETLEFARKLRPKEDRIYYDLGTVYQSQGLQKKALAYFKVCVKLAPNNPRNLDSLLALAIEMKDRILARTTLRQLKEANPENQKITEFEKLVKEM
ncbi:MAG: tetratricopeptide repeat protein [Candidatus Kerfeldbacteria bacterium]|nr:tetratricopeptide repeat protein [Candidatus Kerfeldbacteria bacterium]